MKNYSALNKYWWHRLIKVIFYIITIIIFLISFLIFKNSPAYFTKYSTNLNYLKNQIYKIEDEKWEKTISEDRKINKNKIIEKIISEKKLREENIKKEIENLGLYGERKDAATDGIIELSELRKLQDKGLRPYGTLGTPVFISDEDYQYYSGQEKEKSDDEVLTKETINPEYLEGLRQWGMLEQQIDDLMSNNLTRGEYKQLAIEVEEDKEIGREEKKKKLKERIDNEPKLEKELEKQIFWNNIKNLFLDVISLLIILLKILLVILVWLALSMLFYYKGIIYIIFGDKEIK